MKKAAFLAVLLAAPLSAQALIIDSPSADVEIGWVGQVLDILPGADIGVDSNGRSLNVHGFTHTINISGGVLQGGMRVSGFDHIFNITGGLLFDGLLLQTTSAIFNFTGTNLMYSGGRVTGILADGSPVSFAVQANSVNLTNVLVPAPASAALLLLGLLGLRKNRACRAR